MMKKAKAAAVILILFCAFGFGRVPKLILDDINMESAVGYDYVNKYIIKATSVLPIYKPDKSVGNETFTASDELSKETLKKINMASSRQMVNGKLEVALYSKELAKQGIGDLIDTLQRDPSISERLFLAVTDEEAERILSKRYGDRDTGIYLSMLIEQNMDVGLVPTYNLHQFLNTYYSKLSDPFLPLIGQKGKDIHIKGIALFKGDRYVKSLRQDHQFIFKALLQKVKQGTYKLRLRKHHFIAIENIHTKHNFHVENKKNKPEITIQLKVNGIIRETRGKKTNKKAVEHIKKLMEKQLETQGTEMIRSFQKLHIDPLGLGTQVRSRVRNFQDQKWLNQYPHIKVNLKAHVDILEKGVVD
ncbi:Ger(x)C family spore germination protein [Neobacillus rhizophilus]|uniref:Ger(X)C family spore germination protein n=1 Tax=Neobacillus rhizophilus TaxID=2833579 RepID=A0A942U4S6_9BACI|nr:Ger(x)C family spore germination protein [Neobacillus rhizophilus]MBS4212857.1 Ger(x)C family spore germination protein [Neobacillus rhizophilus]